jgi:hypothetical protein
MYYIRSRGQPTGGSPPAWGLGEGLTTPYEIFPTDSDLDGFFFNRDLWWALVNMEINLRVLAPWS